MSEPKEMSFVDHLEDLRWHLIRPLIAILVVTIVAFFSKEFIFGQLILGPGKIDFWTYRMMCLLAEYTGYADLCVSKLNFTLQSRTMAGQFTMHLTSSFTAGFVISFPYLVWEIWRFVKPGLHTGEKNATTGIVLSISFLFLVGILFGYYVVAPLSINFLANYQLDPSILNQFDITSYVSTLIIIVLACGLIFQLPVFIYFLTKLGFVSPYFLRTYRKHAIVIMLIIAALVTPSPDILSQLLVAFPMVLLYEVSIFISAWEYRKQKRLEEIEY